MKHSTRTPTAWGAPATFDVERTRADFPALHQEIDGKPLVYLDNAATAQKPLAVLAAMDEFYRRDCANIHRGVHRLSVRATEAYESARGKLQRFLGARSRKEIVFVRGATEGINLVAQSWGRPRLRSGDEILVTHLEHHSNIVPWQILCEQTGAVLRVAPIDDRGVVVPEAYEALLGPRTKLVALAHVSNALGTINPVKHMAAQAHSVGAVIVVDGAQAAPHLKIDVRDLEADFYTISGHKMYGPTGSGVLYGREELLAEMPPWQGGGDMILSVSFEGTTYNELPYRFEAGTPHIAGGIGLGAAVDYLEKLGLANIAEHEHELLLHATDQLGAIEGVELVGTAPHKAAVLSFTLAGIHPHDLGTILDQEGVAVRTGHHCAQPVMTRYGISATTRASFGLYNTQREIERLVSGIHVAKRVFRT